MTTNSKVPREPASTGITAVRRVAKALCAISQNYITWPNENEIEEIVNGFSRTSSFPGIIGTIDGTHINIPAPKESPESYINRKGRHSIQLQSVCDHKMRFRHIYVGNAGSIHDARIFRLSSLQQYINDAMKFPNDTHIIGDGAYGLHQHLLVPYPDNGHLTERQENYNFCHSSARLVIERSFGYLKTRWRSLLHVLAVNDMKFAPYHIFACCVLHNVCLFQNDELDLQDQPILVREQPEIGEERINRNVEFNRDAAVIKRNNISANLNMRYNRR
ncbi:PREDICTED: putative nuclease HARBI1 [Wasmannia auropunctata]|uniref:putative nuclease HARBI1 n=1 Tax=Wasmannia auropunctata TaxID=64793 RepID=UPI0005ED6CEC|nr:PREDICTED: putative nuclease HARBI1 [Wasmannia auropunctata]